MQTHFSGGKMLNSLRDQRGFALIELLIAMIIIGVLAAIAIPSFLSQRSKGQDACAKTQVQTMQTAMETIYTEQESYVNVDLSKLHSTENAIVTDGACGNGSTATVGAVAGAACNAGAGPGARDYCISQTSTSGRTFVLARNGGGTITRTCAPTGGSCTGGVW
jgi:type IV pilus assembly protein PilA